MWHVLRFSLMIKAFDDGKVFLRSWIMPFWQVGHVEDDVLAAQAEQLPLHSAMLQGGLQSEQTRAELLVHYQFPPYCTGETGKLAGQPSRREVGCYAIKRLNHCRDQSNLILKYYYSA